MCRRRSAKELVVAPPPPPPPPSEMATTIFYLPSTHKPVRGLDPFSPSLLQTMSRQAFGKEIEFHSPFFAFPATFVAFHQSGYSTGRQLISFEPLPYFSPLLMSLKCYFPSSFRILAFFFFLLPNQNLFLFRMYSQDGLFPSGDVVSPSHFSPFSCQRCGSPDSISFPKDRKLAVVSFHAPPSSVRF